MLDLFSKISTFVFDIDGVLADTNVYVTDDGQMLRTLNMKDSYALRLAVKKGYRIWVISHGKSEGVRIHLGSLGIEAVHIGVENKKEFLLQLAATNKITFDQMLYMGDDIPDYGATQLCALPCCPSDAVPEIKQVSKYISPFAGGKGCVRDVIEKVLKLNGHWELPQ